jgi:hypothetical protein
MPGNPDNPELQLFDCEPQKEPVVRRVEMFTDSVLEQVLDRSAREVRDVIEKRWARARAQSSTPPSSLPPFNPPSSLPPSAPEHTSAPVCPDDNSLEVLAPLPPAPEDMVLDTLDEVINSLKTGREITGLRERIAQLVTNQESRAELVSNMVMTHDFDRLARYMRARASLEDILLKAAVDRTLTPTQALAFLKIAQEQSEIILNRVRAGATNIQDLLSLLNKADYALQVQDAELAKKFSNTSPQGREIIRRLVHHLNKAASVTKVED